MRHRLQRQLRRGKHVPHHVGAAKVSVNPVAAVVRQFQLLAGEHPGLFGMLQARPQLRAAGRVCHYLFHRLARAQQLPLALRQLAVIANTATTVQQNSRQQGNKAGENAVEWPRA
ncbi:hypothetical protein D3C80_1304370 [compost metagenome]